MQISNNWHQAIAALVLLSIALLGVYFDTVTSMVSIWWRSETYTHAFLVLPISLWLIWRLRHQVLAEIPRPSFFTLGILAAVAFIWLLGSLVAINVVTMFAFTAMLVLAAPIVFGWKVAKILAFPLAYLFLMVPFGEAFVPQLIDWTADFTVAALRLSGIPVFREGSHFVIPSGNWSVVEACSGVRYLIASFTVGTLFAYLNYKSRMRRVIFIAFSILVPIVANWLRAYMIVMLGHFSGNKLAVGVDHLIYGWVFFGLVILVMFIVGARWAEQVDVPSLKTVTPREGAQQPSRVKVWGVSFVFLLMVALPHMALFLLVKNQNLQPVVLSKLELKSTHWQPSSNIGWNFKPAFENPSAESNQIYAKADQQVGLYLGYYRNQSYSRKLVSSNNVIVTTRDSALTRVAGRIQEIGLSGQVATFRVTELRGAQSALQSEALGLLVLQIYWINGRLTSNDYLAKVYGAFYRLTGQGDDSAVIVVYAPEKHVGNAEATLEQFLTANYVAIDTYLQNTRSTK